MKKDYYIALGIFYEGRYEFPEKVFFWASSTDFVFRKFSNLNDFHRNQYDKLKDYLTGDPSLVIIKVEADKAEGDDVDNDDQQLDSSKPVDPLASSESEDESAKILPINLKEIDRVHYLVRAIENDTHIVPQGTFKLTMNHEVH